ncbi:MAG: MM0924 family protein [Halobacteriota archaeon]
MLDKTISEHFINKTIEVYFGGRPNDTITGNVVGSADGVIVLEHDQRRDFINVGKVVAFWEV